MLSLVPSDRNAERNIHSSLPTPPNSDDRQHHRQRDLPISLRSLHPILASLWRIPVVKICHLVRAHHLSFQRCRKEGLEMKRFVRIASTTLVRNRMFQRHVKRKSQWHIPWIQTSRREIILVHEMEQKGPWLPGRKR